MDDRMLDDLARLRDETGDMVRRMGAARDPHVQFGGGDAAGAVTVTVDGDGGVCDVSVDRGWRRRVGSTGLSAAVREAAQAAAMARLQAYSEALDAPIDAALPSGGDLAGDMARQLSQVTAGATVDATSGRQALHEILSMLETIDASLDELSAQVHEHAGRTPTGRSGHGHVTASLDSTGALAGVEFDSLWLRDAGESSIAREIREAFEAAHQRAAEHSPRGLIAHSRLGALQDMATDPLLLARRLGLHADGR